MTGSCHLLGTAPSFLKLLLSVISVCAVGNKKLTYSTNHTQLKRYMHVTRM